MADSKGDLRDERKDYKLDELTRDSLERNPLTLFSHWMEQARQAKLIDATAMTLATVSSTGTPSARIVLLKQFNENGFYWYTNYESRKGKELHANPTAALVFYWRELEKQIRIEGTVQKASDKESDEYFSKRPLASRYSAAASPQSTVIENQHWLTARTEELRNKYDEHTLQRPRQWGGYRLQPAMYEFWQGRPSRQHDRFRFTKNANDWDIDRLAP